MIESATSSFVIPDLTSGLPQPAMHPNGILVAQEVLRWQRERLRPVFPDHPTFARSLRSHIVDFSPLFWPTARYDRITCLTWLVTLLFIVDDLRVSPAEIRALYATVERGEAADDPLASALSELHASLQRSMPAALYERFMQDTRAYARTTTDEVRWRNEPRLDLDDYLRLRYYSSYGAALVTLIEFAVGVDLSDEMESVPLLGTMHRCAVDHAVLVNDLFSYRKEIHRADRINALSVLQLQGLSLQAAVDRVCHTLARLTGQIAELGRALLSEGLARHAGARVYVDAVGLALAGNLRWSFYTARYGGDGYEWNGSTSGRMFLYADRTVLGNDVTDA